MHLKVGKQRRKQVIAQKETNGYEHKKNECSEKIQQHALPNGFFFTFIWRFHSHSLFGIKTLTVYYAETASQFSD